MLSLLQTLLGGALLIALVFVLLYRFTRLQAKESAVVAALAALGIYVPLAVAVWPGPDVFAIHLAIYLVVPYLLGIIGSQRDAHRGQPNRGWFHWGPAVIVLFFVAVVAVNAVFITLAQSTLEGSIAQRLLPEPRQGAERLHSAFPGTVVHDYQEKEALYNARLAALARQRERGWEVSQRWEAPLVAGDPARLEITVQDRTGDPVAGAEVSGVFVRPSNSRDDQTFSMRETSVGIYRTEVTLPFPGRWDLVLTVRRGEDVHEVQAPTEVAPAADS